MATAAAFIDPTQLVRIADLQLLARSVVEGMSLGLHRSPHTGASVEFAQYRPYTQGDDPRYVDWRLYGRTDRLHIKQFQRETNLRCTIILDCSASMNYTSFGVSKLEFGKMLAACVAYLLGRQGDAVGLVAYHQRVDLYLPGRVGPRHTRRILSELEALQPQGSTDTSGTLRFVGSILRPRGMVVLISDLLHPLDETLDDLRSLRAQRHDLMVLQLSDPAERSFTFEKAVTLIDAENSNERFVIPDAVREQYLENRANHFSRVRRECLSEEIDIEEFDTSKPLDHALHYFIRRRLNAAMRASHARRGMAGGAR